MPRMDGAGSTADSGCSTSTGPATGRGSVHDDRGTSGGGGTFSLSMREPGGRCWSGTRLASTGWPNACSYDARAQLEQQLVRRVVLEAATAGGIALTQVLDNQLRGVPPPAGRTRRRVGNGVDWWQHARVPRCYHDRLPTREVLLLRGRAGGVPTRSTRQEDRARRRSVAPPELGRAG
jgi:hypothetical protein